MGEDISKPGLTLCLNLVPFIPCYNTNFDSTQSLPSSRKKKGNGEAVRWKGALRSLSPFRGAQRAGCGEINQAYSSNMQIKSPTQLLASPHWRRKPSHFCLIKSVAKIKACIIPLHKANNSYYSVRKRLTQYSNPTPHAAFLLGNANQKLVQSCLLLSTAVIC